MNGRPWCASDLTQLRELASVLPLKEVARRLRRTPDAVSLRARREGVLFTKRAGGGMHKSTWQYPWTESEVRIIWELAGRKTVRQIARKLRRSACAVRHKAARIGIRLTGGESIADVARYLGVSKVAVTRWRNRLGQEWCRRHKPRGPELEEMQAIARCLVESVTGNPRSTLRLRRIAEGRA